MRALTQLEGSIVAHIDEQAEPVRRSDVIAHFPIDISRAWDALLELGRIEAVDQADGDPLFRIAG